MKSFTEKVDVKMLYKSALLMNFIYKKSNILIFVISMKGFTVICFVTDYMS